MSKRRNPTSKEGQEILNSLLSGSNNSTMNELSSNTQANANTNDDNRSIAPANKANDTSDKAPADNSSDKAPAKNASNNNTDSTSDEANANTQNNSSGKVNTNTNTQDKNSEKQIIDETYKQLLGSKPTETGKLKLNQQQSSDLDLTMERATAAVIAGNKEEAAYFFRIHEQMKNLNNQSVKERIIEVPKPSPKPFLIEEDGEKKVAVVEGGFTFVGGASTNFDSNIGLTPFFEKNIRELRMPVPLTIFNEEWQDEAWQYHTEKKIRSDDQTKAQNLYSGLPYPHEFTQNYMAWATNYRNFIKTIRNKFKFCKLAEWLEKHKENVEEIREEECWMVAFRYDLKMRTLLLTEKVTHADGLIGPIDISEKRRDIKELCFAKARKCDELGFFDNPYAKDGERFDWDHNTGAQKRNNFSRNSSYGNQINQNRKKQYNNNNQNNDTPEASGSNQLARGNNKRKYMGSNFDPHYAEKKAKGLIGTPNNNAKT
ncbi:hypothetical protein DFH28DRAFT_1164055, partial [Melampsora americana]